MDKYGYWIRGFLGMVVQTKCSAREQTFVRWRCGLTVVTLMLALLGFAQTARASEVVFNEPMTFPVAWTLNWNPSLATDGQGVWVAAWTSWDQAAGNIGTDRDIVYAYSVDDGDTWSWPAPLNALATSDTGVDWQCELAAVGHRRFVAVWCSEDDMGIGLGPDADIVYSIGTLSETDEFTWTFPGPVNNYATTDYIVTKKSVTSVWDRGPNIATDGNGMWTVVWRRGDIVTATSINDGQSWSDCTVLAADPAAYYLDIAAGGDTWCVVTGSDGGFSAGYLYRGTRTEDSLTGDISLTWGPATLLDDQCGPAAVASDKMGYWAVVLTRAELPGTVSAFDRPMARLSVDDGKTWTLPIELAPSGIAGAGPDIAVDGAGTWLAVANYKKVLRPGDSEIAAYRSAVDQDGTWSEWTGPEIVNRDASYDVSSGDFYPRIAPGMNGRWVAAWSAYPNEGTWIKVATADTIPLTVAPRTGLVTSEDGGQVSFAITLDSPPTAPVTIPVSSDNEDEGVVVDENGDPVEGVIEVVLDTGDRGPKTVTVRGIDDSDNDGDVDYHIVLGTIVSDDLLYNGLDPSDVCIVNLDNNDGPPLVGVYSISYSGDGRDLYVGMRVKDQDKVPVAGASVAADLYKDGVKLRSFSGVSDSTGLLRYVLKSAKSGTYTTTVTSVVAEGLTWDGITPENSFTK